MTLASPTPLKFLAPGWFSPVMGLCGLALAWRSATPALGEMATGGTLVLAGLALLVFVAVAAASLLRWQRHPQALAEDLQHPVRHAFVATVPVSLMLLATCAHALGLGGGAVQAVWWTGSLLQWWATLWVLGRWLAPQTGPQAAAGGLWPGLTPVLFVPVVGNVVAPLAGVGLGHPVWAVAQFGVGALFWPVVLTLVLARRLAHGPLPDRLLPTWAIALAPPSVIGLALLQLQAPLPLAMACWGVALFTLLWVGAQGQRMVAQPFGLLFWAWSFPLAAFSALTLQLADRQGLPALQTAGLLALALTSLVVVGLVLGTVRGLRQGTLLAPEPVAAIVPANSP
ncbi:C4-dicarboxylate ABC transporter [Macromonas nakdongensis]|uniref:SLAC1 family transporter n=1 Tax=Macromonas nakdongensis TaxID=1843082 RepID=UPI000C348356|nr:C4-dicarboxylate ABC transporter [Macromonas nakdongensis]